MEADEKEDRRVAKKGEEDRGKDEEDEDEEGHQDEEEGQSPEGIENLHPIPA